MLSSTQNLLQLGKQKYTAPQNGSTSHFVVLVPNHYTWPYAVEFLMYY